MTHAEEMQVRIEPNGDAIVVTPIGDVDLGRAPSLRVHLARVIRDRPRRLVVDLHEVPYMDSSGVATLVEAMQSARTAGAELHLCRLQDRVRSIFEIARLDMVFKISGSLEEALG